MASQVQIQNANCYKTFEGNLLQIKKKHKKLKIATVFTVLSYNIKHIITTRK